MRDLLAALGLVFVIEGALYALFPAAMQRGLAMMQQVSPIMLRIAGVAGMAIGWVIVHLARGG